MLKSTKLKNTLLVGATAILVSCGGQKEIKMGSYAYDAQFLKDHGIEYTELVSADGNSKVMVIPAWQGRVMTTSASGDEGDSYGCFNIPDEFVRSEEHTSDSSHRHTSRMPSSA